MTGVQTCALPISFKTEKPINPKKLERNTTKRASPSAHRSTEVFATQKRAAHIDGHDLAPGFDRKVGERHARWKNCCVVHQHFAATPRALDFFSSCNDRRLVTNVAPNRQKRGRAFSRSTTFRSSSTTLAPMLARSVHGAAKSTAGARYDGNAPGQAIRRKT